MVNPHRRRVPMAPGLSRIDRIRLWGLGGLFVLVLGAFLVLRSPVGGEADEGPESARPGPRAPADDGPTLPGMVIDPAWVSEIREETFEEAQNTDERPLWLILRHVRDLGIEGYLKLRESDDFGIESYPYSARPLEERPQAHRFRLVGVLGRLLRPWWEEAPADNPGEIERVSSAWLFQDSQDLIYLVSPHRWSEYGIDEDALEKKRVRVEGIFYKRYMYIPEGGPDPASVPLVVVTGVFAAGEPEEGR